MVLLARFFGDATRGGSDDCRPCACPLEENKYAFKINSVAHVFLEPVKINFMSHALLAALLSPAMQSTM